MWDHLNYKWVALQMCYKQVYIVILSAALYSVQYLWAHLCVTLQSKFWCTDCRMWLFIDNFGAWKLPMYVLEKSLNLILWMCYEPCLWYNTTIDVWSITELKWQQLSYMQWSSAVLSCFFNSLCVVNSSLNFCRKAILLQSIWGDWPI